MKKTVYLVRHGQTTYNARHMHQFFAVPLSKLGYAQADRTAKVIQRLHPDVLLSSDIARARQTAEHISTVIGKEVIFNPLFRELARPTSIVGKNYFSLRSIWIFFLLYVRAGNRKWRVDDEENFSDFRDRAHKAVEFLENYDAERIVVVSHRILIGGMLAAIKCRFACSMGQFMRDSIIHATLSNCGITTLEYDSENEREPWTIVSVNDIRHLEGL